jgi:pimeloyl-ACP methyl ester carboxylesterase
MLYVIYITVKEMAEMKTKRFMGKVWKGLKRGLIGLGTVLVILAAAGLIYQTAASEADQRKYAAPGSLIDVGGFKMHIYCTGQGSPTVILEALSGGFSSYWGWVQPQVAQTTHVCAYDRAGRGWSEPDPQPQSLERSTRNLHTLLVNANIPGPYVLVGHSIGGLYVRQFAAAYAGEVAGIVLLDAAHPEQFNRHPEMLKESNDYMRTSTLFPLLARLGVFRLYFAAGGEIDFADLAEPQKSEVKAAWSSPAYFESQRAEIVAGPGIFAQARELGGLGSLPLMVITRGQGVPTGWMELQDELVALSRNSAHITVQTATHASLAFNPQDAHAVSQAIGQVIRAVHSGLSMRQILAVQ